MLAFLIYLAVLGFFIVLATKMARRRNRSPVAWGWLTFLFGVFAILALWSAPVLTPERPAIDPMASRMAGHVPPVVVAPQPYRAAPTPLSARRAAGQMRS